MAIGDWFKHDIYCLQDDRLFTLVSRFGAEGYAVFFHTIEAMYANAGNPIYDMTVRRIAFDLSLSYDKVLTILDFASSDSCHHLIHIQDDGGYVSSRVMHEMVEREEKRQRFSNMGRTSAEHRLNTSSNVGSTQVERKSNVGSTDKIRQEEKRIKEKVDITKVISPKKKNFQKPTIEEVKAYCRERNNTVDAQGFIDFYESKNWMIGKNHMTDWKAAVRTWERKDGNPLFLSTKGNGYKAFTPSDITGRYSEIESEVIEV